MLNMSFFHLQALIGSEFECASARTDVTLACDMRGNETFGCFRKI